MRTTALPNIISTAKKFKVSDIAKRFINMSAPDVSVGDGQPTDIVTFIVVTHDGKERKYEAEKRKLASASKVFRIMFEKPSDVKTDFITVKDFSPRAFKMMLRHVYKKAYCLDDWELSLEVFRISEMYQMSSLQEECEDFFSRSPIDSSNALKVYKLASKYNVQRILATCEEVFERDSNILLIPGFNSTERDIVKKIIRHKTQLNLDQMLALIDWGRHECHRRNIEINSNNIEKCVSGVCGTALAIGVSKLIEKPNTAKKKAYISGKGAEQQSSNHSALISLNDSVGGTIMDSFSVDIICEVKITVFNCVLEFTGIELHLKKSCAEESSLEIFYSTENMSEGIGVPDQKVDATIGERKEIAFSQGLIVKSGQFANITVRIEDLQMSYCLQNSKVEQVFIDKTKGIHFKLEFRSNQASPMCPGPFVIEKLLYKSLS